MAKLVLVIVFNLLITSGVSNLTYVVVGEKVGAASNKARYVVLVVVGDEVFFFDLVRQSRFF